jgi:ubiquinone/menaquinone biosynthesis C-methylase UbiE
MPEWFEDESFWIDFYPFMFSEERFAAAKEEVEKAIRLLDFKGSSVLDLCCGPGRCSLVLAERGLTVTGVDRTKFLLEKAKKEAESRSLQIEWILSGEYELLFWSRHHLNPIHHLSNNIDETEDTENQSPLRVKSDATPEK